RALVARAIASRRPAVEHDWRASGIGGPTFAFAAVLPIVREDEPPAALLIVGDARDPFAALDDTFLVALGRQIGGALEGAELTRRLTARSAELTRLSARMIGHHEAERRRISLELHDETAQVFSVVKLQLGVLRERVDPGTAEHLARVLELVDTGMQSIRDVTETLRPSLLDDLGLLPAIRSLAADYPRRSGIAVRLDAPDELPALDPDAELALFRAMQEALSNVARHAGAERVEVRLTSEGGIVELDVRDDGLGFPADADLARFEREGHLGLAGMRERIASLGGTVQVAPAEPRGAHVRIRLPVSAPHAGDMAMSRPAQLAGP
ncbi:MAG: GAF domain-containing sensor histidine kinase, partial [Cytophagaceae bacterium]|nr:GAF domain-containing sensor histidine kinase [Gemmatimonadaceae bacterium]